MAAPAPLRFLAQSFKNSGTVGAVWPSSKGLSRAMVAPIFSHHNGPLRILEVGAGVGPFTAELVERLLPGDHLDVVELNPDFCTVLRTRFIGAVVEPTIHEVSILDFDPGIRYHHVLSGLPLANFPSEMVEAIYNRMFDLLEPNGTLIMFQHVLGRQVLRAFGAPSQRDRARRIMEIEERLNPLLIDKTTIMLNMPPAQVLVRRRPHRLEKKTA